MEISEADMSDAVRDPRAVLTLTIPPEPRLSRVVRSDVMSFATAHGVSSDDLMFFLTAMGEALANAIEHARAQDEIEVEVVLAEDRIVGKVADRGVGFDGGALEAPPGPSAERGRGLPIMRDCSDIFALRSVPGCGTAVTVGRLLRSKTSVSNVA